MSGLGLAVLLGVLAFGLNTVFWSAVGIGRYTSERLWGYRHGPRSCPGGAGGTGGAGGRGGAGGPVPKLSEVAVLIAAHNEAEVIADTVRSACRLVPASQVYVVSDGSSDATAAVARTQGVRVLELLENVGKAGALNVAFMRFGLSDRARIVMLLDADSQPAADYLHSGLPLFADPSVAVVAGRARTDWDLPGGSWRSRIVVAHRERSYVLMQRLLKYGQASRHADVVVIAPGFASMYRSEVLAKVRIDPVGLVIEDFNMTFEVHRHGLGRIAFNPGAAVARTQDPDRLGDYRRQVSRWALGFWQTVRLHGLAHPGKFWLALTAWCAELVLSSMALLAGVGVVAAQLVIAAARAAGVPVAAPGWLPGIELIVLMLAVPHLLLSVAVALGQRRVSMLLFAPAFVLLTVVDAWLALAALVRSYGAQSTGSWRSPPRRSTDVLAVG